MAVIKSAPKTKRRYITPPRIVGFFLLVVIALIGLSAVTYANYAHLL